MRLNFAFLVVWSEPQVLVTAQPNAGQCQEFGPRLHIKGTVWVAAETVTREATNRKEYSD